MEEMSDLENRLGQLLSPRQPSKEFVQTLKHRLTYEPQISIETRKRFKVYLILAAALFSGGLIVFILLLLFGRKDKE